MTLSVKPPKSPIERRRTIIQRCLAIIAVTGVIVGLLVDRFSPRPLQPYCHNLGGTFHLDLRDILGFSSDERVPGPITKFFYDSYPPSDFGGGAIEELPDGRRFWRTAFVGADSVRADDLLRYYTSRTVDSFIDRHHDQIPERMAKWKAKPQDFGMNEVEFKDLVSGTKPSSYSCALVQVLMTDPSPGVTLMDW